jgi:alkylhydroperoxidase family enzyme
MADTLRVPKAEITGIYGAVVKKFSKRMFGAVPESVQAAWHHKPVVKLTFGIGQKTRKWNECDENLKSFAHMATAAMIGCSFCLDFGYFMAHNEGLDEAKAREVPRWRESDVFSPLERDVMEYAEAMTHTPPTVSDELSDRLLDALGAPALIELGATIAVANYYARSNTALGVESEGLAASCGLQPLAEPAGNAASAT